MTKSLNAYIRWRFYKIFEKRLLEVAFNQQSALEPKSHTRISKSSQTLRGELELVLTHF